MRGGGGAGREVVGEGRFINGGEGVVSTILPTMKEICVFWLHCIASYYRDQAWKCQPRGFTSAGVLSVSSLTWKCFSTAISGGVYISEIPACHFLQPTILSEGHKNYLKDW